MSNVDKNVWGASTYANYATRNFVKETTSQHRVIFFQNKWNNQNKNCVRLFFFSMRRFKPFVLNILHSFPKDAMWYLIYFFCYLLYHYAFK